MSLNLEAFTTDVTGRVYRRKWDDIADALTDKEIEVLKQKIDADFEAGASGATAAKRCTGALEEYGISVSTGTGQIWKQERPWL